MTIKDEMLLIEAMTNDLKESVLGFDKNAKVMRDRGHSFKPMLGNNDVEQGETSYAIERKIVTIREHLNTLRKRIVYYNGSREQEDTDDDNRDHLR